LNEERKRRTDENDDDPCFGDVRVCGTDADGHADGNGRAGGDDFGGREDRPVRRAGYGQRRPEPRGLGGRRSDFSNRLRPGNKLGQDPANAEDGGLGR